MTLKRAKPDESTMNWVDDEDDETVFTLSVENDDVYLAEDQLTIPVAAFLDMADWVKSVTAKKTVKSAPATKKGKK